MASLDFITTIEDDDDVGQEESESDEEVCDCVGVPKHAKLHFIIDTIIYAFIKRVNKWLTCNFHGTSGVQVNMMDTYMYIRSLRVSPGRFVNLKSFPLSVTYVHIWDSH